MKSAIRVRAGLALVLCGGLFAGSARDAEAGSVVRFDTVVGSFDVQLFEDEAPLHVQNFLDYVEAGDYDNSLVHRNAPNFVVQSGRFNFDGQDVLAPSALPEIASRGTVQNEPGISNTRGTLALAKLPNDPNSGSSEWFINLEDNSSNLDNQNGGFTVFGEVLGDGMDVVDAIAQLPTPQFSINDSSTTVWNDWPLRNVDSVEQFDAQVATTGFGADELVIINSISVLADSMPSEQEDETPETGGETGGETGSETEGEQTDNGGGVIEIPDDEEPETMMPSESENGSGEGGDIVPDEPQDPIFAEDREEDSSGSDGSSDGDGSGDAEAVPTPGAFAAGLLGLGFLAARRRRTAE